MNRLKSFLFLLCFHFPGISLTAQPLTLDSAYLLARLNYPQIRQLDLIRRTENLTIENLSKGYLPQVAINASGTYQSEVTQVKVPLPGLNIEPLSKDQYRIVADISQLVYDGGNIRQQKINQQLTAEVERQVVEVELYKIWETVTQLYTGVLLIDEQIARSESLKSDLENGIHEVAAQLEYGITFRSSLSLLQAEALTADQKIIELWSARETLLKILSVFIGKKIDNNTRFAVPNPAPPNPMIQRPEIKLFDDQFKLAQQNLKLLKVKNRPKASLFAQSGYGRPGLNMLENDFSFFYIAGLRLNIPLSGFYTLKADRQLIYLKTNMVEVQRDRFLLNLQAQLTEQETEVKKIERLIEKDKEIISLRQQVKEAALAQLENQVITSADYLREVNAEDRSRLNLSLHKMQLLQAKLNYQILTGNK